MDPISPSKSKSQKGLGVSQIPSVLNFGLVFVILLIGVFISGVYISRSSLVNYFFKWDFYYTVVLDCGSTGTRVNVYKWRVNGSSSDGNLPILLRSYPEKIGKSQGCQYHCMQTEPGLDKFVGNGSGVRVQLEPLIHLAEQWVPWKMHGMTPVFVLATAGMRRLSSKDARQVLGDVEDVVKKRRFLYRKDWIRVLSGKEEAYYAWIALNFKMGILGNASNSSTLGLLDLGGSSLQVVAEVDEIRNDEHIVVSKVGNFQHHIVAYSLPAFGLNEAFERTVAMLSHGHGLTESTGGKFEIRHPCLNSDILQNYTCSSCFGLNRAGAKSINTKIEENELNSVLLYGTSNWEDCKILAKAAAFNSSSPELSWLRDDSNCLGLSSYGGSRMLNLTSGSHPVRQFHALSGFYALQKKLNLSSRANMTKVWETGQHLCLESEHDEPSTLGQDCFRLPYMASLISDALCLRNVEINFGPGDITWTLGAALVEGEYLWLSNFQSQNSILSLKGKEIVSSPILLFILLLCLLFIVYRSQIKLPMLGRKIPPVGASLPSYLSSKRQPE